MLFIIDTAAAYELAGVADAAAADMTRPILARVQVSFSQNGSEFTLRAVATDSHMLAKREIIVNPELGPVIVKDDTDDDFPDEGVTVDAKQWKKVLKEAAAERGAGAAPVLVDVAEDAITVARDFSKSPEARIPTTGPSDGTYPKWRQLFGERVAEPEGLPAFNPTLLRRMESSISAKPADRSTYPVRLYATKSTTSKPGDVALRPWLFASTHTAKTYRSELEVIVMPMRVADAA